MRRHADQDRPKPPGFPVAEPPAPGQVIEVAPGILWARIPLPFRLNHINVYLIDDGDGWAILDTGIGNDATRAVWDALVNGPLAGRRLTRLIVTHFHPDHIGLAGWLCERFVAAAADEPDVAISAASTSRSAPARSTPSPIAISTCATASMRPRPSASPPRATAT